MKIIQSALHYKHALIYNHIHLKSHQFGRERSSPYHLRTQVDNHLSASDIKSMPENPDGPSSSPKQLDGTILNVGCFYFHSKCNQDIGSIFILSVGLHNLNN